MRFSVIVPMYNVEDYAKKCIESILVQSFRDFELIIVNDGSKDGTSKIINYYKNINNVVVIHKENGGLVSARKKGISVAKGDYIIIVDGDDWIDSNYLFYLNKIISKYSPDMICLRYYKNSKDIVSPYYGHLKIGMNNRTQITKHANDKLFKTFPSLWTKVVRRSIYYYYQNNVDDRICMGEDSAVVLPLISKCNSIYVSNKAFYHYRYNPGSLTNQKNRIIDEDAVVLRLLTIEKQICLSENMKRQFSAYVAHITMNAVVSYFRNCNYKEACKKTDHLIKSDTIRRYLQIFPSDYSKKELFSWMILRYKFFILIKIFSLFI